MYSQIIISMLLNSLTYTNSKYLGEESNFSKSNLQRKNVLNKGLWIKDKIEKPNIGSFIFRADSTNVDNLLQNNFDAFGENYMETVPIFTSYVERNKRSTIYKPNQQLRKSLKKCRDKSNCLENKVDTSVFKSKVIPKLKPASVFNDYPYEVAILLANNNKREIDTNKFETYNINDTDKVDIKEHVLPTKADKQNKIDLSPINATDAAPSNKTIVTIPKRRMIHSDIESESIKQPKSVHVYNTTEHIDGNKIQRNIFEKEDRIWKNVPIQNTPYNIMPTPDGSGKNKSINEKGLVKILSLLTKTFRKVIKGHNEIQEIDRKLHSINEDFVNNVATLDKKFKDFDTKYTNILKLSNDIKQLNENFIKKSEDFEHKDLEMANNLMEFENQQKKFLAQQRQFYTIQKLMFDQNEKINWKQSLIAKTQSEISHRQNNFARILKKAKQFYTNAKFPKGSKLSSALIKPNNAEKVKMEDSINNIITTSTSPTPTQSVKINLLSIPKMNPLKNQDKLILNEKDDQSVDDLVYKYYFNNTMIADLMKNNILAAILHEGKDTRNAKNKRNDVINLDTTILLPVVSPKGVPAVSKTLHRERRWIKHSKKNKKRLYGKHKPLDKTKQENVTETNVKEDGKSETDPYLMMATNFCIQLGQNSNAQTLNWCIEKSLRRLKSIDMITPMKPIPSPPVEMSSRKIAPERINNLNSVQDKTKFVPLEPSTMAIEHSFSTPFALRPDNTKDESEGTSVTDNGLTPYFPDNDELESNLKQFDLTKDPEGTVYFDGSVHTSDIVLSESDALSDVMPGLDSNSHVEVDPLTLDMQARRRAYVRRLNKDILRHMNT